MEILVTILHVASCMFLIFIILIQAGRGGGLSEMLGSNDQAQRIFGAQTNAFLVKLTTVSATCFIITSVTLAVLTANKSKSLIRKTPVATAPMNQPATVADVNKAIAEAETHTPTPEPAAKP